MIDLIGQTNVQKMYIFGSYAAAGPRGRAAGPGRGEQVVNNK